jgi:hypothetical protein
MNSKKKKEKITRCFICLKKLIIIEFKCKCDNIFCNIHRYPEEHNCTYDHKKDGKRKLKNELENTIIKRQKIDKI